jgi:hypothetical protein
VNYLNDEQRSQTGWIGVQKCEVILKRALSTVLRSGPATGNRWVVDRHRYFFATTDKPAIFFEIALIFHIFQRLLRAIWKGA